MDRQWLICLLIHAYIIITVLYITINCITLLTNPLNYCNINILINDPYTTIIKTNKLYNTITKIYVI
jgi:hypothetical protein